LSVVFGVIRLITSPAKTVLLNSIVPTAKSLCDAAKELPPGMAAVVVLETQAHPVGSILMYIIQTGADEGTVTDLAEPEASVAVKISVGKIGA
jgi:hypothetical protein